MHPDTNATPHMHSLTAAAVAAWSDPARETVMTLDDAVIAFHTFGPRAHFIKTLPVGASVLDAGAGDGSSIIYKSWPFPARQDLEMYAWAGDRGAHFDAFAGHEVGYWPQQPPTFGGRRFDAVFSGNFIEHIDDPMTFIRRAIGTLTPGGRIYLEWPRVESITLPSTAELADAGVRVTTGRYHDDGTHRTEPPMLQDVLATLASEGLSVTRQGIVRVPMVDQQLAIHARRTDDIVSMTLAYWSLTGWCQYVVAERT
jgi:SAM-dependent methyltransferase